MSVEGLGVVQPVSDVPGVPVEVEHRGGIGDEGGGLLDEVCHDPRERKQVAVYALKAVIKFTSTSQIHYSGSPLLWTPRGPGEVYCTKICLHFRGKFP